MECIIWKMIRFFIIFIAIVSCNLPINAETLDYAHGYFKKLKTKYPLYGQPIKLQDGRIYISSIDNIIYNPVTNTFSKAESFNKNIDIHGNDVGTLLNNGKILFIAPYMKFPSEEFEDIIYKLINNDLNSGKIQLPNNNTKVYKNRWQEYSHLTELQKQQIYLPYIKKEPLLHKMYNKYLDRYNNSLSAQLYNPATNKFEYTGKINIRRNNSSNILLKNGNVLRIGGLTQRNSTVPVGVVDDGMSKRAACFELYDPATGQFTLLNVCRNFGLIKTVIQLNDGRLFIESNSKFFIYNPETQTFFESKHSAYGENFLKLSDDRIIFSGWTTDIKEYNPYTDELKTIGRLLVPRGSSTYYNMTLLPDDNIIINGGENLEKSDSVWIFKLGTTYEDRVEIFNPNTKEIKLLPKMHYKNPGGWSVVLDDGRVLFYFGKDVELYIPKGYKVKRIIL